MTLPCPGCAADLSEDTRFCGQCGQRQPEESAADVARYTEALQALGGRTEAWATAELAALRRELRIRSATHARLSTPTDQRRHPVAVWVDTVTLADFRVAEVCLVRVRVRNMGARAVSLSLSAQSSTSTEPLTASPPGLVGPGQDEILAVSIRPDAAGHHTFAAELVTRTLGGETQVVHTAAIAFRVAAANPLQQSIHIDARNQRVGIFENIGAAAKGGLVGAADWSEVALATGSLPVVVTNGPEAALPAVGLRASGVVVQGLPTVVVEVAGTRGALVEVDDPTLLALLAPGDRLQVTVLGHDGRGGLLLSTRTAAPVAAPVGADVRVGPGDSLAAALSAARPGSRITVGGTHVGPFVISIPLELTGDGTLEAPRGPVLTVSGDVVVRGLTVRGAAPPGAYAADALEVRAGRVVVERCTLSSDAAGNLTPGRAVAVTGPATLELRDCSFAASGFGVAIDVSWSGFATDDAAGARVRVEGCRFAGVGTAVALAGANRVVTVVRCELQGARDRAVHVMRGATATVEENSVAPTALLADPGATLVQRGNRP